jgi:DNA repair exonuclease SbcCD ATPase subunit
MKTVNKTTSNFVKIARGKIKAVKAEFSGEIKKQESLILPKVNRINEEYDQQTTQLTKTYQKQLLPLQKEKVKFEKNKEQIVNKIERCRIEAKTRAASKDAAGEKRWKEKADESKKELSETESKIKEVDRKIKEIEESNSLESFRLRSEWEAKVKEAKKDLLDLEASRDAKIQIHQQEIEKLESLTATIIQQIDSMAKLRETSIAAFEKLGFKQKRTTSALIYLPFYLACYQAESKRRYVVFTPSMVNNVGLSAKIKGVLGGTKLKQLLVPRFKSITSLLHKIPLLIEQNAVLGRETEEAGDKADITRASSLRESIRNGAMKLKEEGWLSEKEHENVVQKLT